MRTRFVIPAAILVTAAYVKGRTDATSVRPPARAPIPVAVPGDAILRAEAEAADARLLIDLEESEDCLVLAEEQVAATTYPEPALTDELRSLVDAELARPWAPSDARPPADPRPHETVDATFLADTAMGAPAAVSEPEAVPDAAVPPLVEVVIDETGHFSLGGWATQAGHMAVHGVTFRGRRDVAVGAGAIRLIVEADENCAPQGLVVLGDAGFGPDREGFTILLAAAGPGHFAAAGRYEVVSA